MVLSNIEEAESKSWLIDEISEEINERNRVAQRFGGVDSYDLRAILSSQYLKSAFLNSDSNNEVVKLVDSLTCLYVDNFEGTVLVYRNEYMDSPTCETCFEKKFMSFYRFIMHNLNLGSSSFMTYCSSDLESKSKIVTILAAKINQHKEAMRVFSNYENEREFQIQSLVKFGALIDDFIESENCFFLLEYIMNALIENEDYNAYYVFKIVSLIEMLVKNPKDKSWSDSDYIRFAEFINEDSSTKEELARLIIQIRNKIGHGNYKALSKKMEEYATKYMIGYNFDYYEYSRNNWVFLNLSCALNEVLARIIWTYLNDKSRMKYHKPL